MCGGDCAEDADADGICDDVDDCVGELDACGVCNGPGEIYECGCADIPEGDCDCDGNQLDALGVCGGDCAEDADADGICDDVDDCVGELDACGVCNGPGEIYECGCADIPEGDCDCDGNQLDALGVCGGDCAEDADADGICDDVDDCVGELDACGVCNGPGEIYECGCADIPEGDCDCDGNQLDALGVCGGDCAEDDADGICDDVDDCVGALDACGVCNGPGEIYECGCTDIPEGDCDCDGNQLDALGVCGGDCAEDADADGICDDVDECVGELDALGVCGGDCEADVDNDGICDDVDDSIEGCTDACACNYLPGALVDDGNCDFDGCSGCIYVTATNYDETAIRDDNSCVWEGCTDPSFLNYNPYATADAGCSNVPSSIDFNNDGNNNVSDLISFLQFYGLGGELISENATVGEACTPVGMSAEELTPTTECDGCCPSSCGYEKAMNYDPMANKISEVVCLADARTRKRTTSTRWRTWTTHLVATAFVRTSTATAK